MLRWTTRYKMMAPRLDLMDNGSLYPQDWLLQSLTYIGLNYVLISKKFDRVLVTRKVNSKLNPTGFDHIDTFLDKDINIKWGRMYLFPTLFLFITNLSDLTQYVLLVHPLNGALD